MSYESDDKQRQRDEAKAERKMPGVEKLLRQFLTIETGQGKSEAYRRGHEFSFDWPQEMRDRAFEKMNAGMTFEEAFDAVKSQPDFETRTQGLRDQPPGMPQWFVDEMLK